MRPNQGARNESGETALSGASGRAKNASRRHEAREERPAMRQDRQNVGGTSVRSGRHRIPIPGTAGREERAHKTRGQVRRVGQEHEQRRLRGCCTGEDGIPSKLGAKEMVHASGTVKLTGARLDASSDSMRRTNWRSRGVPRWKNGKKRKRVGF